MGRHPRGDTKARYTGMCYHGRGDRKAQDDEHGRKFSRTIVVLSTPARIRGRRERGVARRLLQPARDVGAEGDGRRRHQQRRGSGGALGIAIEIAPQRSTPSTAHRRRLCCDFVRDSGESRGGPCSELTAATCWRKEHRRNRREPIAGAQRVSTKPPAARRSAAAALDRERPRHRSTPGPPLRQVRDMASRRRFTTRGEDMRKLICLNAKTPSAKA